MPKEFEDMVSAIKATLKKANPKMDDKECESRAYAIATDRWKKSHGGKAPQKMENLIFNFMVPITEFYSPKQESNLEEGLVDDNFFIEGIAINATTTANNHKFLPEELRNASKSLNGVPLLIDHKNEVLSIMGRVIEGNYDESLKYIKFKANVKDKEIRQRISDGRINSVSVGAAVKELEEDNDGTFIPRGISFKELSLVAVPADEQATFSIALKEAYDKISQDQISLSLQYDNSIKEEGGQKEMSEKTPETQTQVVESKVEDVKEQSETQLLKEQIAFLMTSYKATSEELDKIKKESKKKIKEEVEESGYVIEASRDDYLHGGAFTYIGKY